MNIIFISLTVNYLFSVFTLHENCTYVNNLYYFVFIDLLIRDLFSQYLLQKKAAINVETHDGWQPLHSASFWNNTECMVLLIQYGADINAMSRGQQSPLHLVSASSHNSPGLQLLLLHPDTNSHQENSSGDTAKNVAQRTGKYYALFEIIYPCLNNI